MLSPLHLQGQQPRNQYIRAEDDHEAARDHAAIGKHDDDPAGGEEKETDIAHIFKAKDQVFLGRSPLCYFPNLQRLIPVVIDHFHGDLAQFSFPSVPQTDNSSLCTTSPRLVAIYPAQSLAMTSACSKTVWVAFSCLSGG